MEKQWEELSPDEKREALFQRWLSPQGVEFVSPKAEKAYKERITRIKDVIQLKKAPDRVPVVPIIGFFPAYNAGLTPKDMMYDYEKLSMAFKKYVLDFEPDAHIGAVGPGPGKLFDILDYKLYAWPGHGVSPNHTYQCLEGEYMTADEYDALIQDPSYFFSSTYFPRIFGALEPFKMLAPLTNVLEMYGGFSGVNFIPYGLPPVQAAYKALFEAGAEALKWIGFVGAYEKEVTEAGFPNFFGGGTKVPFDTIGDTLRGTKGIMLDMYRQPDKLLQALEAITPLMIKMGASAAKMNGNPIVFIPLHKGADGFLSDEQFKKFYWPTFRKLLIGLIDEGCVPFPWAEGGYNSRLKVIRDLPKGKTAWGFDTTDMAKAKEILGDVACIGGNMPIALLSVGTPQEVKDYTKKLIETAGKGGGYIMINGAVIEDVKPENVRAWIDATKEYGVYK
ncbi:MAG: uroporphyrinogen decarboxylase [Dehalococcoidia bacterium]|nr:uroporphyrinogen decarboxylase [Dehalococcoidia bacterium]